MALRIFIIHGQGTTGGVQLLATLLATMGLEVHTPTLPHGDATTPLMESLGVLHSQIGEAPALVVGLGTGGYLAARLQETAANLTVMAVSAPDSVDHQEIQGARGGRRIYLYSSVKDAVLRGRQSRWAGQAEMYDLPWLDLHSARYAPWLAHAIAAVATGADLASLLNSLTAAQADTLS